MATMATVTIASRALAYSHDMEPHSEATRRAAHVVGLFGKPDEGRTGRRIASS